LHPNDRGHLNILGWVLTSSPSLTWLRKLEVARISSSLLIEMRRTTLKITHALYLQLTPLKPEFLSPTAATSLPIHVHRIILSGTVAPLQAPIFCTDGRISHEKDAYPGAHTPWSVRFSTTYTRTSISGHPQYCADIIDVAGIAGDWPTYTICPNCDYSALTD